MAVPTLYRNVSFKHNIKHLGHKDQQAGHDFLFVDATASTDIFYPDVRLQMARILLALY